MRKRKKMEWDERTKLMDAGYAALFEEYSEHIIRIPEHSKWDFALPEMYLNYQDGFICPKNVESYRGMPLFVIPGKVLYLRHTVNTYRLADNEAEKYLCFDRQNNKYTVIIEKSDGVKEHGNPSYFRFLPKVEKYLPKKQRKRKDRTA